MLMASISNFPSRGCTCHRRPLKISEVITSWFKWPVDNLLLGAADPEEEPNSHRAPIAKFFATTTGQLEKDSGSLISPAEKNRSRFSNRVTAPWQSSEKKKRSYETKCRGVPFDRSIAPSPSRRGRSTGEEKIDRRRSPYSWRRLDDEDTMSRPGLKRGM
ncbi:hypothetical protein HAX54_050594 [Datura stramonium]|uniref:Uncharacterized protein n=1 Tax=Datura stramonium TaxID=4076 RepID=A0ABS8WLL3_DATST|nr:hypothetical protein [Datura stramonium]